MQFTRFQQVVDAQFNRCVQVLGKKRAEYAPETDVLHNFTVAAALQSTTPRQAAAGMAAKHAVSIFDMAGSKYNFGEELWDEKITDMINYLVLLRAIVAEDAEKDVTPEAKREVVETLLEKQPEYQDTADTPVGYNGH